MGPLRRDHSIKPGHLPYKHHPPTRPPAANPDMQKEKTELPRACAPLKPATRGAGGQPRATQNPRQGGQAGSRSPISRGPSPARREKNETLCFFLFFTRAMRKGGAQRPSPAPKQEGIHPAARRSPFGGGAGRHQPCPNGALLEKNGQVTRREEAAGASRWGLGSENRPSRQWALNNRCQASSI